MLQVCLFVPFLHQETPRPTTIPKSELKLDYLRPKADLMASILQMRQQILQNQTTTQSEVYSKNRDQLMSNIPEMASYIEDDEQQYKGSKNLRVEKEFGMNASVLNTDARSQISNKYSSKAHSEQNAAQINNSIEQPLEEDSLTTAVGGSDLILAASSKVSGIDDYRKRMVREMG